MIPWLAEDTVFPPVHTALHRPNGLLCAGGDLSPERLLEAYRHGIFPWFSEGEPILWWSPDPRMVLFPSEIKISRSLARTLRCHQYEVRLDTAFANVIEACALPRADQNGTWITPAMQQAYCRLHTLGYAHSVETWIDGQLSGGLYGMALGRCFFGESMFSRRTDASKIALAHLARYLERRGYAVIDCQMKTAHLASLGAREIPRDMLIRIIESDAGGDIAPGPWPNHDASGLFATIFQ